MRRHIFKPSTKDERDVLRFEIRREDALRKGDQKTILKYEKICQRIWKNIKNK